MDENSRSQLLRRNEQIKAATSLLGNAGLGLFAAGLGRWFFEGFDVHVMLWLLDGVAIIGVGVMLLTLLEAET
jgi:hypothetical protein